MTTTGCVNIQTMCTTRRRVYVRRQVLVGPALALPCRPGLVVVACRCPDSLQYTRALAVRDGRQCAVERGARLSAKSAHAVSTRGLFVLGTLYSKWHLCIWNVLFIRNW